MTDITEKCASKGEDLDVVDITRHSIDTEIGEWRMHIIVKTSLTFFPFLHGRHLEHLSHTDILTLTNTHTYISTIHNCSSLNYLIRPLIDPMQKTVMKYDPPSKPLISVLNKIENQYCSLKQDKEYPL